MNKQNRVMWSEGMFLLPQHFQHQDEFHQRTVSELAQRQAPFYWGVQRLEFDQGALERGTLRLTRLKVVLPDGTLIDAPQHDPLPPARDLNGLAIEGEVRLHIALRLLEPYAPSYTHEDDVGHQGQRRYVQRFETLPDLNEGSQDNELEMLENATVLLLETDELDGYSHCPIGLMVRNASGRLDVDSHRFMPPALHMDAVTLPGEIINRLLGLLGARSDVLSSRRREHAHLAAEFGSSDVTLFWLLYTINQAWPELAHMKANPQLHPEQLYRFLARLASGLMTFSMGHQLSDIPEYQHGDPAPSLLRLEKLVRELLDIVIPNQYVSIPLEQTRPSYYIGRLHDERLVDADFFICVHADMPGAQLIDLVPRAFKVGSPEEIEVVVNTAMPGVTLEHATRLPSAIPVRLDNHYFSLEPHGSVYERMMAAQALAFYVPSGFRNLSIELMAVMK
ncbi:type VI secretion system-associated protein [Terasakiispira papahanaumokuakeensis]|uniref:Type VI secretion system-associated protein n=1 Tax=Terasakiispira papahanaumokuakeensis TaxID=197479 RepID=A0A1E2V8Z2_9GAMM|nr:type VI secretion system baseplate subunit TssK [Terasakiispira papahanaumokuakeensis]ODC03125.1 type VI secretion system-associated protein [Terasakiispira papahanaumokuakeensis]